MSLDMQNKRSSRRAGLPAPPGMKTAGLGRPTPGAAKRPARAVVAAIFRLDAHAVGRTTVDENPAGWSETGPSMDE